MSFNLPVQRSPVSHAALLSPVHKLPESGDESFEQPPNKKLQSDDNWRVARPVLFRDQTIKRFQDNNGAVMLGRKKLRSTNNNHQVNVSKQKASRPQNIQQEVQRSQGT